MVKKNIKYLIALAVLILLFVGGIFWAGNKLTYLEYRTLNEKQDTQIALNADGDELKQEFVMPYDILDSVSVKINTFGLSNNSTWTLSIIDKDGRAVYADDFNASRIENGAYFKYELKGRLKVNKGEKYTLSIKAKSVDEASKLGFFMSSGNNLPDTTLMSNGSEIDNTLCFKIYGGDRDGWWFGLVTFLYLFALAILVRIIILEKNNKSIIRDTLLQGLILGGIVFLMHCTFATQGVFTDESDNIRGGMVIANGGVLYRDYVVQHPPVMYYTCALFAVFGAGSIEQFRLAYYILVALVFALLYVRHKKYFGAIKMALLPIVAIMCITTIITPQGYQVLSDGFQGLCLIALILEFIRYYEDRRLHLVRCIIVSLCVWGCFGSAFVSAYALVFIALAFIVLEIRYLIRDEFNFKGIVKRYYKLLIALVVPLIIGIIYFGVNGALGNAFEQIYTFNRTIYPKYIEGAGAETIKPYVCSIGSPVSPFINAIQNFGIVIIINVDALLHASLTFGGLLQLVLVLSAVAVLIKLFIDKKFVLGAVLACVMIFSATRGYNFHGLAAWYVIVLIIVLYADLFKDKLKKAGAPLVGVVLVVLSSAFFVSIGNNLTYKQESVTELESRVVELTENDESKAIFHDAFRIDSIYLYYKGRTPVNRAVYMLPWYMERYESADIQNLKDNKPRVVVYDEDRETWGMTHYTNAFDNELKARYTRLGDSGWQYKVWIRND